MRKILLLLFAVVFLPVAGCTQGKVPKEALMLNPKSLAERQMQTRRFDTTDHQAMLNAASGVLQDLGFTIDEADYSLGVLVASKKRDATSSAQVAGAALWGIFMKSKLDIDSEQVIRVSLVMRELEAEASGGGAPEKYTLTQEKVNEIKEVVRKNVAAGLTRHFPAEISKNIAGVIAQNTAETLSGDLSRLVRVRENTGTSTVRVTIQRIIYDTAGKVSLTEQVNEPELYQKFFEKLSQSVFLEAHGI